MFKNIYQGKRVLVTGHTGFKGSWLCIWLKELGAEVVGYSLDPPSEPNNFSACRLSKHIDHQHGDVRDHDRLISIFSHYKPEMVFHLAAQALVRPSYDDPKGTFDTNAGGTVNVLEAVRRTPDVRVVVNVTSDKCYENREWVWGYRENDPLGGHDPYSASKGCAELVFSAYLKSFFSQMKSGDMTQFRQKLGSCPQIFSRPACGDRRIGAASCRAGNAIGGGDWGRDRLIPDCVRALSTGRPVGIRNPQSVRPQARFGALEFDGVRVSHFKEKSTLHEGWINGGFFIVEPEALRYIQNDVMWEHAPMETMAAEGKLCGFQHEGFWQCMDTSRDLRYLESLWETGSAPWKTW